MPKKLEYLKVLLDKFDIIMPKWHCILKIDKLKDVQGKYYIHSSK